MSDLRIPNGSPGDDASSAAKLLDYAAPASRPSHSGARWLPGWAAAALTLLQVLWLVPSAILGLVVGCYTNGAPIPMFLVSCFATLPATCAFVAGIASVRHARSIKVTPDRGVLAALGLSGFWIAFCAAQYIYFLFTRSPNDVYCP